ncbi:hypothetical protein [Aeromicrobium sp. CF3.5]|uniref:hypothetical protein n=1 Tax=Aeromicrobium sp. CF3.5 TaxID=3373078 RepID=UPI003EE5F0D7
MTLRSDGSELDRGGHEIFDLAQAVGRVVDSAQSMLHDTAGQVGNDDLARQVRDLADEMGRSHTRTLRSLENHAQQLLIAAAVYGETDQDLAREMRDNA